MSEPSTKRYGKLNTPIAPTSPASAPETDINFKARSAVNA
ncbi:hypothetical protein ABIE67_002115 [Streptomyces sp. V4I8]